MIAPKSVFEEDINYKPHFFCKILGHKFQLVAWISYNEKHIEGRSICSRCGYVEGVTTFGPFYFRTESNKGE